MTPFPLHDGFDKEYCQKAVHPIGNGILRSYRAIQFDPKYKALIAELGSTSLYYASLHKSHFDYIVLCYLMFTEGLPYPRPLSGNNLFKGPIAALMEKKTKVNIRKWGAISMERGGMVSRNLAILCRHLEELLKNGKSVLFFPEMEVKENGRNTFIKTGRSYTGQVRTFAPALFGPAIQATRNGSLVYVIPISVAYDFIAEDRYFKNLSQAVLLMHGYGKMQQFLGEALYLLTESAFFFRFYRRGGGDIYIDLGRPIRVDPSVSRKELALNAFQEATSIYRVTLPALVAYLINKGFTNKTELAKKVNTACDKLPSSGINFHVPENIQEDLSDALDGMSRRGLVINRDNLIIRNPHAIRYYANTVAHHLDDLYTAGIDQHREA
jgi:glycerol-3-phosphate O-acyltransferase